jgi:signal transduction histidine kinase
MRGVALGRREARPRRKYDEIWTGLAFVAVVASFLAATTFVERRMGRITSASSRTSDVCVPAILQASRMQGDLARLEGLLDGGGSAPAIAGLLESLDEELRLALALALPADARAQWVAVTQDLEALGRELAPRAGGDSGARSAEERRAVKSRVRSLVDGLDVIADTQREHAALAQRDVHAARAWTGRFTYGLDAACILLAALVAVQTLRMLRTRRRAIEQHVGDLEDFAVRVAHDIRSPLMPALLALQKVRSRLANDDPARHIVDRGIRSVQTTARTVDGLLTFASAGAKPERPESSALAGTLDAVVAEYLDAAIEREIDIGVECSGGPMTVACSAGVLASVLGNLVGNALKFMGDSKTRRVVIRARAGGGVVHVEVEDSGPGLPEGAEGWLFEPYERGGASAPGLGLGLATVKRLVTAHGGSVGVRRGEPGGCVFWVDLPACAP